PPPQYVPYVPYETAPEGMSSSPAGFVPVSPSNSSPPIIIGGGDGVLPLPVSPGGGGGGGGPEFRCEVCSLTLNSENQLLQHFQGRQHLKAAQRRPPNGTPPPNY